MADVELDYEFLMQNALRQVVRDVIAIAAQLGAAPGEHHFYIEFLTGAEGVIIPDHLRSDYPERMTIVLQHQFENLGVDEEAFFVTLWFKGKEANLRVPFAAVTSFADPSVEFGLRFVAEKDGADERIEKSAKAKSPSPPPAGSDAAQKKGGKKTDTDDGGDDDGDDGGPSADVVSLDSFRKK